MTDKLKECPFCGGAVTVAKYDNYWSIIASGNEPNVSCGCRLFMESELFDENDIGAKQRAKEKLIEKWNNRPSNWHTGTPKEDGDYLVAFRMLDNSVEYGWCNWNNGTWDILCDYDPTDGSCGMIAWQKIEPCNWVDFLFSERHCDNWREVRKEKK